MPTSSQATRATRTSGTGDGFVPSSVTPFLNAKMVAGTSQKSSPRPSTSCVPVYLGMLVHSAPPILTGHVLAPPAPASPPSVPPRPDPPEAPPPPDPSRPPEAPPPEPARPPVLPLAS